jgi:hypothetical protein
MFQHSAPTLLAYGGTYANVDDIPIENILPFAFPFGIGGPKMKRRKKVSLELCIQLSAVQDIEKIKLLSVGVVIHPCVRNSYLSKSATNQWRCRVW